MPSMISGLHGMDDVELTIRKLDGFATLTLRAKRDEHGQPKPTEEDWPLFFSSIEAIRSFRNRLNAAIIKFDTRKSSEQMVERIERAAEKEVRNLDKVIGDQDLIPDYLRDKGRI